MCLDDMELEPEPEPQLESQRKEIPANRNWVNSKLQPTLGLSLPRKIESDPSHNIFLLTHFFFLILVF